MSVDQNTQCRPQHISVWVLVGIGVHLIEEKECIWVGRSIRYDTSQMDMNKTGGGGGGPFTLTPPPIPVITIPADYTKKHCTESTVCYYREGLAYVVVCKTIDSTIHITYFFVKHPSADQYFFFKIVLFGVYFVCLRP